VNAVFSNKDALVVCVWFGCWTSTGVIGVDCDVTTTTAVLLHDISLFRGSHADAAGEDDERRERVTALHFTVRVRPLAGHYIRRQQAAAIGSQVASFHLRAQVTSRLLNVSSFPTDIVAV
jgi:hypothetical protein